MSHRDALASLAHLAPASPGKPSPARAPKLSRVGQFVPDGRLVPAVSAESLILPVVGAAVNGYHGYLRNRGSLPWTLLWGAGGFFFPVTATAVAIGQGYGSKL